mgnify:CR=1 FL=1
MKKHFNIEFTSFSNEFPDKTLPETAKHIRLTVVYDPDID